METGATGRAVTEALRIDDLVNPEFVDRLHARCAHIVGEELCRRTTETLILNNFADNISIGVGNTKIHQGEKRMSKYNFEGQTNVGAVGDNASATDFVQGIATGNVSEAEMNQLSEQLQLLISELKTQVDDDPEAAVAITNLEGAKTAIDQGETSKAMAYFNAAGKWALEKASAIGVPVVIATLKGAMGLK